MVWCGARARLPQLLNEMYAKKSQIYYLSYPIKIYYMSDPSGEPPDYAEKVGGSYFAVFFAHIIVLSAVVVCKEDAFSRRCAIPSLFTRGAGS